MFSKGLYIYFSRKQKYNVPPLFSLHPLYVRHWLEFKKTPDEFNEQFLHNKCIKLHADGALQFPTNKPNSKSIIYANFNAHINWLLQVAFDRSPRGRGGGEGLETKTLMTNINFEQDNRVHGSDRSRLPFGLLQDLLLNFYIYKRGA